jgi:hypothetical protein
MSDHQPFQGYKKKIGDPDRMKGYSLDIQHPVLGTKIIMIALQDNGTYQ